MNKFIKTALVAAALMSASPLEAGQYVTRGFGTMPCREVVSYPNPLMMAYVGGFLNGVNGMTKTLPNNLDVANGEETDNIVRMVRITCKKHPNMDFDRSIATIVNRLTERAYK